jgi:hypothetical protein
MQKILVEVTHQDQIFVENECTIKGITISQFFEKLIENYKEEENNFKNSKKKRKNSL